MSSEKRKSSPSPVAGKGLSRDEIELGYVSGIFGVRGEVRLFLHNRESDLLDVERDVVLIHEDGRRMAASLRVRSGAGKRILGRLAGVEDRDAAASWMGWRIGFAKSDLPVLDDDEFWYWQLEGLPVFVLGEEVGCVTKVHETDNDDVLEIAIADDVLFLSVEDRQIVDLDIPGGGSSSPPEALEES